MPVPIAGNPIVSTLRSDARRSELRVAARRFSSEVRPPRCMLAAWMTSFALSLPPVVTAASPNGNAPDPVAFLLNLGTAFTANRTRDARAEDQVIVGSVDDSVERPIGDVALRDSHLVAPTGF